MWRSVPTTVGRHGEASFRYRGKLDPSTLDTGYVSWTNRTDDAQATVLPGENDGVTF